MDTFDRQYLVGLGEQFEIVDPYDFSGEGETAYIKVKYMLPNSTVAETGWILYSTVQSVAVENDLNADVQAWDNLLTGLEQHYLTYESLQNFIKVQTEIDTFKQGMRENWVGSHLDAFERRLNGYLKTKALRVKTRLGATIAHLFAQLSTGQKVDEVQGWAALLSKMQFDLEIPVESEVKFQWEMLLKVGKGADFEKVYAEFVGENTLRGNPKAEVEGDNLEYGSPIISPGSAYTSDKKTNPAPESEPSPSGSIIEQAYSKAGLKQLKGDEKIYTKHERDFTQQSIYIDGKPTADDVAQTGLGDCYYLSVVSSIADKDPSRIKQIIPDTANTDSVVVTLYFKKGSNFFQQQIVLNQQLAYPEGTNLKGSRFKIRPADKSIWILKEGKQGRFIEEVRLYKTALWAPLLEKAYARFAEQHGQYGNALKKSAIGGYDIITQGGRSGQVYSVFYGSGVTAQSLLVDSPEKASTLNAKVPEAYITGVQALLQFADRGGELKQNNQLMLLSASASPRSIFQRVVKYAETMKKSDFTQLGREGKADQPELAETQLDLLKDKLETVIRDSEHLDDDSIEIIKIKSTAENYSRSMLSFIHDGLLDKKPSPRLRHLMQLLYDMVGGEARVNGPQKRFIYTRHAYTVLEVNLIDNQGNKLTVNANDLDAVRAMMDKIDWLKSSVTLFNPHHGNTPNPTGKEKKRDTGKFTLWLTQFFRNFTMLHPGIVQKK
ncbi:MAG: hypothetical protein ABI690_14495 [Chloroflexota bacterium]